MVHDEPAAERVRGLVADDEHRVERVAQAVLEVVQHAAGLAHPARRDHHARAGALVELHALVHLLDVPDVLLAEEVRVGFE